MRERGRGRAATMSLFGLARPLLHRLDPETAHRLTLGALRLGWAAPTHDGDDPALRCRLWDLALANPIGLAAGFDKNAEVADAMLGLGFGAVEVGTITPRPQAGNPRPRVFRLAADRAVINRLGFNNAGLAAACRRLGGRVRGGVVGANIGANRDSAEPIADYLAGLNALHGLVDYLAINVSSPNTPGLRDLQQRGALDRLLGALTERRAELIAEGARSVPLTLKIAPDLDAAEAEAIAEVALARRLDGLIVANTTIGARERLRDPQREQSGGLSGAPLFAPSTALLAEMYRLVGARVPLIAAGGVSSGRDAYAKIRAGASLVQLYTALIYQGPDLVTRIKRELSALLKADGLANVAQAVGADIDGARARRDHRDAVRDAEH